ncbi:MAG TPA: HEAT repeat domain-containing protein [Pirellulales bacterium]|jgi:HEAT repeat protein|nr:HEAT repeat domain-containing protein [Pirellulales bacterium]
MKTNNQPKLKKLARQLDHGDQVRAYQAQMALMKLEAELGAASAQRERQRACGQIVEILAAKDDVIDPKKPKEKPKKQARYSAQARRQFIRVLAVIGGDSEVSALEEALDDFEVREMARWALDRMPAERAADVLADAATKTVGDEFRIGVVNSLGRKATSPEVVSALRKCLSDSEPEIRLAAVEALANHADASLDPAIAAVAKGATAASSRRTKLRVSKARMRLAERLSKQGDKDAAQKIYDSLAKDDAEGVQKRAAGLARDNRG